MNSDPHPFGPPGDAPALAAELPIGAAGTDASGVKRCVGIQGANTKAFLWPTCDRAGAGLDTRRHSGIVN